MWQTLRSTSRTSLAESLLPSWASVHSRHSIRNSLPGLTEAAAGMSGMPPVVARNGLIRHRLRLVHAEHHFWHSNSSRPSAWLILVPVISAIGSSPVVRQWRGAGGARQSGPGPQRPGPAPLAGHLPLARWEGGGRVHRARGHRLATRRTARLVVRRPSPPSQHNEAICSLDADGVYPACIQCGGVRAYADTHGSGAAASVRSHSWSWPPWSW